MTKKQITIMASRDGKPDTTETVSAEVEGVLALHRALNQEAWTVTHVESGRRIIWFYKRVLAYGCMIELAHSVNWSEIQYSEHLEDQERNFALTKPIVDRWVTIDRREHLME